MKRMLLRQALTSALLSILGSTVAGTATAQSLGDAIADGEGHVSFRLRTENVDQNGIANDANAITLRTRLNYKSDNFNNFHLFLEADDISYLRSEKFNNGRNNAAYPVIADPKGTDVNQAYIGYSSGDTAVKFGRQRINIDTQRFVGGVGWRQNEQTYDALTVVNTSLANTTLTYAYVNRVLRIWGPDDPGAGQQPAKWDSNSHLLNAAIKIGDLGTLNVYGFRLDFNDDAPTSSNTTIGARFAGQSDVGSNKFLYVLEYARQQDAGENPNDYTAAYYNAELGIALTPVTVKVGTESIGGDATTAGEVFITPLATAHKFQGWADKFLAHPAAGIKDNYLTVTGAPLGTRVELTYHTFDAEDSSMDYGSEIDCSVAKKVSDRVSLLLKYARYDADKFATDTTKFWFMVSADF